MLRPSRNYHQVLQTQTQSETAECPFACLLRGLIKPQTPNPKPQTVNPPEDASSGDNAGVNQRRRDEAQGRQAAFRRRGYNTLMSGPAAPVRSAPAAERSRQADALRKLCLLRRDGVKERARSEHGGAGTAGSWALAAPMARSEEGANACAASGIAAASSATSASEIGRKNAIFAM